jgi:hypothetical protein
MAVQVAAENVVGRDKLIDQIWQKLQKNSQNSLRLTAERRIGKTTVMTKMAAEPRLGFEVLFMDLEGIDSPDRFTELLLNRVKPLLSTTEKAKAWLNKLKEAIGGTEIGGVFRIPDTNKMGWQATLEKTLEGLCEYQADKTIVLLLDELPYMLQKIASIKASEGQKTLALTLLDTLRSIRQQRKNLRMIYAGSIGLHHVVTDLKQAKLASEPLNDMPIVDIHALSHPDAMQLAARLLGEEKVKCANPVAVQQRLVLHTDCVPFYIEAVCSRLGELEGNITPANVDETVRQQLSSDHDPWEMEHFRSRLKIYYSGIVKEPSADPLIAGRDIPNDEIARAVLDHLSVIDEPQSIEQVWSTIKTQYAITDRNHIVGMLKSLSQDHYLISDTEKRYSFRFPMIQGWWKMVQGLEG